jgi:ketosteroid isomerase-like protein
MNNSFTGSLEKAKKAEWMKKSKSIEPVIDQLTTDLMDDINKHDLKKYHSYFANDGSFGFVWNGDTRATLDEMKKIDYENITNYNDAAIVVKKQLVGVIDETLATSTQKYAFSAAKKEGGKITADGNWSLIWKLDNGQWKIVQAFETNNLTNE